VLVLCGSAFAGDMGTPPLASGDIPKPPGPSHAVQADDGSTNVMASDPTADAAAGGAADDFSVLALSVINSVLALL
jgi:hypothetical protein